MTSGDDIKKFIAIASPNLCADKNDKNKFEKLMDARKAGSDIDKMKENAKALSLESHKFVFDGSSTQLEPIYFWILDFMREGGGIKDVSKLVDNFTSSPGSGHFGEMGMRASKMQEEGMKVLGTINTVVKSVLNLVYDLKEFEIRIGQYKDAKSENQAIKDGALLSLKQLWLDQIDMKKGNSGVKAMTFSQSSFATLLDAFMIVNSPEEVKNLDLNDRVKRVLEQRIAEFNKWIDLSEKEINKRFEIEKSYLKTQVESLKLYASWARPYLKAAEELRMKGFPNNPALVNAFNTAMFELVLMGKIPVEIKSESDLIAKNLPPELYKYIATKKTRNYNAIVLISFVFRGLPQRVTQRGDYGFGGRIEMSFDCFAMNEDELKLFNKLLEKDALSLSFDLLKDAVDAPLQQLKEDLDKFIYDKAKKVEKKEEKKSDDINPFTAFFELFKFKKKEDKKAEKDLDIKDLVNIKPDNYIEEYLRFFAADNATKVLYRIYDVYKKAHGQASSPDSFDPNIKSGVPGTNTWQSALKKSWNY